MFDREMMLNGLQKQRSLLHELILEIEGNLDRKFAGPSPAKKAKTLAQNFKKLRDIKSNYQAYRASLEQGASRTELKSSRKAQEWEAWTKFKGINPQVHGPVSESGIYADFT
jgi:hypothetical protein